MNLLFLTPCWLNVTPARSACQLMWSSDKSSSKFRRRARQAHLNMTEHYSSTPYPSWHPSQMVYSRYLTYLSACFIPVLIPDFYLQVMMGNAVQTESAWCHLEPISNYSTTTWMYLGNISFIRQRWVSLLAGRWFYAQSHQTLPKRRTSSFTKVSRQLLWHILVPRVSCYELYMLCIYAYLLLIDWLTGMATLIWCHTLARLQKSPFTDVTVLFEE